MPDARFLRALLAVVLYLPICLSGSAQRAMDIVPFKSLHRALIVVDVYVNGLGPFAFLLDTGATSSCIDEELSSTLHLATARSVRLATWSDTTEARSVAVQNLALGPINSGPIFILVQPLRQLKGMNSHLHGVLGQDVLLRSDYLIDNQKHRIEVDPDGSLLLELTGERVETAPVKITTGGLETRLFSIPVRMQSNAEPLHLLLDSGTDMVVLQPRFAPGSSSPRNKLMANDNGKLSSARSFYTTLSVGSERFGTEAWISNTGLPHFIVDGLLSTACFDRIYISNTGGFVISEPKRTGKRVAPAWLRHSLASLEGFQTRGGESTPSE